MSEGCVADAGHFLLKSGSTLAAVRPAATSARIRLRLYRRTSFLLCSTAAFKALVSLQPWPRIQARHMLPAIEGMKSLVCPAKGRNPSQHFHALSFHGVSVKAEQCHHMTAPELKAKGCSRYIFYLQVGQLRLLSRAHEDDRAVGLSHQSTGGDKRAGKC